MEEKIEIFNKNYHLTTEYSLNNILSSKIFLDSSNGRILLGEIPTTSSEQGNKEVTMQTFHKKVLSSFLRLIYTYREEHNTTDKIKSLVEENLLPEKEEIKQKEETKQIVSNDELTRWQELCRKHLPNNILAVYKQKGEALLNYSSTEYNDENDQYFIDSIQDYLKKEEQNIVHLVNKINILTLTIDSKYYFVYPLANGITLFIIAPMGSLGMYIKLIESFKDKC